MSDDMRPLFTDCALLGQLYADDVQAYLHCLACDAMAAIQAMTLATGALWWPGCHQIDCGSIHLRPNTSGWALGCCEKLKIGIVPSNSKIKLPFDMGFNKVEKFFKHFNVFDCNQGAKVTENKDFL